MWDIWNIGQGSRPIEVNTDFGANAFMEVEKRQAAREDRARRAMESDRAFELQKTQADRNYSVQQEQLGFQREDQGFQRQKMGWESDDRTANAPVRDAERTARVGELDAKRRENEMAAISQVHRLAKNAQTPEEFNGLMQTLKKRGYDVDEFTHENGVPIDFERARRKLAILAARELPAYKDVGPGHSLVAVPPDGGAPRAVYTAPAAPAGGHKQLEMIEETDKARFQLHSAATGIKEAIRVNDQAYEGIGALGRATAAQNLVPWATPQASATIQLDNLVGSQMVEKLRPSFGGNPTEGERAALAALQGGVNLKAEDRKQIYQRLLDGVENRMEFEAIKADALRRGTYGSAQFDPIAEFAKFEAVRQARRDAERQGGQRQGQAHGGKVDPQAALRDAQSAIARGADPQAVARRLQEAGIDPSHLGPSVPTGR